MYPRQPRLELTMTGSILRARELTAHLLPLVTGHRASHDRLQRWEGGVVKVAALARLFRDAATQSERDL